MRLSLPHLTFGKVLAGTAVLLIWTGGTAYAAATITGADIVNSTITTDDLFNGGVTSVDILNATITQADLADNSVGSSKVLDYSLSNADINIFSVQVAADGDIVSDSGQVIIVNRPVTGEYVVTFIRPITQCSFLVTHGPAGRLPMSGTSEAVAQVSDRTPDPQGMIVNMADLEGNPLDAPFHLIVVC